MRRSIVGIAVIVCALAAAELWLRARGFAQPPSPARAPEPPTIVAPQRPRAAPLLIVGAEFTAAAGLRDEMRWTSRLATKVVGMPGFSEVVVAAPLAEPGPFLQATLGSLARTSDPPSARGLNVVQHGLGADVVVIEADGAALGGDPEPFVIGAPPPPEPAPIHRLALLNWFDRFREARALETEEQAVDRLVATDGFVAGAAAGTRRRLEELTPAVSGRRLDERQLRFLRALITELHGLHRNEVRQRAIGDWHRLLGQLRMEQRSTLLILTGPALTQVALAQIAFELAVPVVHAPPFDLDPRLRTRSGAGRAAAAVHAEVADAVWAALTRRGILPRERNAPEEVVARTDEIEAAARARGGVDQALITLAHGWLAERCDFGASPPPEALFGVGAQGRLAPGIAAEVVLKQPSLPDELVVTASVKEGTGAPPRLKLRHAKGELLLEPKPAPAAKPTNRDPAPSAGRVGLEYRAAAPKTRDVVVWPAYEFTVVVEAGTADPEFELASVALTRATPPDADH